MPVPSDADLLVAELVGLLFEGLGLDDTLDGPDSLALVHDIAALESTPNPGADAIQLALVDRLGRAQEQVEARRRFVEHVKEAGREPSPGAVLAAQRILAASADREVLSGLHKLPAEVVELRAHEFKLAYQKVHQACLPVNERHQRASRLMPSAFADLDLRLEAAALRSSGRLFGLFGSPADGAKERVMPHLIPQARNLGTEELAALLEDGVAYCDARTRLTAHVAAAHPWVAWAVDVDRGLIRQSHISSLRWLMDQGEAGTIGPLERSLLVDDPWRLALTEAPGQRWAHSLGEVPPVAAPAEGQVVEDALGRMDAWLARPPLAPVEDFEQFVRTMTTQALDAARAILVTQAARNDVVLAERVRHIVTLGQGAFGSGDPNRARFRALMTEARDGLIMAGDEVTTLRPQHPQLAAVVAELREIQALALGDLAFTSPARGPLRVAIAGRTKAGKTSLRNVLVRDLSQDGVGQGAHRTTRSADAFIWNRIIFVDTPGVAAKDDDYDADVAIRTCNDADAAVWVFAESLRDEEAQILQGLLATKPMLVIYNAKESVATPRRLEAFARNPALVLGEAPGFAARIDQVARSAGVRSPLFLAVHVTAGRRALMADGEAHPAWSASGVPVLEAELRRVLASEAQGLRSIRLADQVRTPVLVAAARALTAHKDLVVRTDVVADRIAKEERELRNTVRDAMEHARATNRKNFARVQADLSAWVERMKGRPDALDAEWATLLTRLDIDATLAGITTSLLDDANTSGLLLDREDRLNAESKVRADRKKPSRLMRVWRVLKGLVGTIIRQAPKLRSKASVGPLGWVAAAADLVVSAGRSVSDEVRASQIDRHAWETEAGVTARRELRRLLQRVDQELNGVQTSLEGSVGQHFAATRSELASLRDALAATRRFGSLAERVLADIDQGTVERVLHLGGLETIRVMAAERVPNRHLHVRVDRDAGAAASVLETVFAGCSSESVTVTQAKRKNLRIKEITA